MTKGKFHIIILFFVLGLFIIPNTSFACEVAPKETEKTCCTKKTTNVEDSKLCCDSSSTSDKEDSCNGKCGHSNCTAVSSVGFSLFVYNEIEFTINNFNFSTKKSKFHHSENLLSDGYSSIWLIPKIS